MRRTIPRPRIRLVLLSILFIWPTGRPAAATVTLEYEVWMKDPHSHYFDVAIRLTGIERDMVDLIMPAWTPGSYVIRDYARHVVALSAVDGAGKPLPVEKLSKSTWRVHAKRAATFSVRYRVYAFDEELKGSHLDESHAFLQGASLFLYVDGFLGHPVRLKLHPAPTWSTISTGLDPVPEQEWTYQAPSYDVLADCPIEIGRHRVYEFEVRAVPHRLAIHGLGNYDADRLINDARRIVEAAVTLFGDLPYTHYTFIVHLTSAGSSGLEHANSSVLRFPRWGFTTDYSAWLSLVAHELFHAWNAKRIRPKELGSFDYTRENYTRMLWVVEGITDYYADRLLRQAGLITESQFLQQLANDITDLQVRPGHRVQSVAEASFDAWIKFYQPNENSRNTTVSYYTKGKILGMLLDLDIRHRSGGTHSLDDVMRTLYRKFYKERDGGYSEQEFRRVCERLAGRDLGEFFDRYVYGTDEIDYERFLRVAGLRVVPLASDDEQAYLGIEAEDQEGRIVVESVIEGTPAYHAGIYARDEIMAVDGLRVNAHELVERLRTKRPGESVTLTISRQGIVRAIDVVLSRTPATLYQIVKVAEPTPEQESLYRGWVLTASAPRSRTDSDPLVSRAIGLVR